MKDISDSNSLSDEVSLLLGVDEVKYEFLLTLWYTESSSLSFFNP